MSLQSRFNLGIVASMEEGQEDLPVAEVEVGADSAEAAIAETADAAGAVAEGTTQIESAQNDADALTSIIETVEGSEAEGGLDPVAAEVVEVAVESIYQRLGIKKKPLVSVEAFSNKTGRLRATNVAVEDWKEQVKRVWKAIVEAFGKVLAWIQNFFRGLFDASAKLSNRATALKKAVAARSGATAKEAEIASGSFVKNLTSAEGFDAGKAVAGVAEVANAVNEAAADNDLSAAWSSLVKDQAAFDAYTTGKPAGGAVEGLKAPEGFTWQGVASMPGNKTIAILTPAAGLKGAEGLAALRKVKVDAAPTNAKLENKAEKVATLSLDQISSMADAVVTAAKGINGKKAIEAKLKSNLSNFINEANSIAAMGDAKEDKELGNRATAVAGAASAATNTDIKFKTLVFSHALAVAQSGLDYAEKSLKQYAEPKAEPAKK